MAASPQQKSSSPKWIRPVEVLSLRRKTKRSSSVLQPLDCNVLANRIHSPLTSHSNPTSFNPFRKFPQKRKIDNVCQENLEKDVTTPGERSPQKSKPLLTDKNCKAWTPALFDETANSAIVESNEHPKFVLEESSQLPLDWSLKTRLRFMSTKPFPFRGSLKTSEEASGTTGFARCFHSNKVQECTVDTSANAKFHHQCLVWQQPSLPWLKLFPRYQENRGSTGQASVFTSNPFMQESLLLDWQEGLRSLFQLVRARQCPFFYFCGHSFTILFRAAGVGSLPDTHALLTPTTSGIRKLLRTQGIDFSLPLCQKTDSQDTNLSCDDNFDALPTTNIISEEAMQKETEKEDEEEEPGDFLESLGLSQQDFPSLNPKRRKVDQDLKEGSVDGGPESLVCMEGPETQALMDYLLSDQGSLFCTANTGPLACVPPTLLAPCAFHGATLRPIKARQGWVKQGNKTMHCVDLSGPILPNMVHGLVSLFTSTQESNFSAVLASDTSTESFSSVLPDKGSFTPSAFATENLKDCGLSSDFLQQVCSSTQRANIHELHAKDKSFTWS